MCSHKRGRVVSGLLWWSIWVSCWRLTHQRFWGNFYNATLNLALPAILLHLCRHLASLLLPSLLLLPSRLLPPRSASWQRDASQAAALHHPVWVVPCRELSRHIPLHKLRVPLLVDRLPDVRRQPLQAGGRGTGAGACVFHCSGVPSAHDAWPLPITPSKLVPAFNRPKATQQNTRAVLPDKTTRVQSEATLPLRPGPGTCLHVCDVVVGD